MEVSQLKRGEYFILTDSKQDEVFQFMRLETDGQGVILNCRIKSVAFKMDNEWHMRNAHVTEHNCNYLANVSLVKLKFDIENVKRP